MGSEGRHTSDAQPVQDGAPQVRIEGGTPDLQDQIVAALRGIYDPEIPVNIYDLGLIYAVQIAPDGAVHVQMTLTAPGCPAAFILPAEVEDRVGAVPGVQRATVEIVWDPPWTPDRMSESARLDLGMF